MKVTKNKIVYFLLFIFLAFGISLRFINLKNTPFDWDQENILARPAQNILLKHDLPLIGGVTSVGNLYIGPLYSYLSALFFYLFNFAPIAGAYLSAFIFIVTLIISVLLVSSVFSKKTAFYFALFWTSSSLMLSFERVPWNVNLLPLSSVLFFSGLLLVFLKNKQVGWVVASLGVFLAFNSHIAFIFYILTLIVFALLKLRSFNKYVFLSGVILVFTFLPLLVFNLKHGFLIFKNSGDFLATQLQANNLLTRFISTGYLQISTFGQVIFAGAPLWIIFIIGLLLVLIILFSFGKSYFRILFVIFNLNYLIIFSLYKGHVTDYYFLGLLPLVILSLAIAFEKLEAKYSSAPFFLIIFLPFFLNDSFQIASKKLPSGLEAKEKIVAKIKEVEGNNPLSVNFDMAYGLEYGYSYLFDYYQLAVVPKEKSPKTYWISFPAKRFPGNPDYVAGEIALGFPQTAEYLFSSKDINLFNNLLKLRIPQNWFVLDCPYQELDKYLLTPNLAASCKTMPAETGLAIYNIGSCTLPEEKNPVDQSARKPISTIQLEFTRCILIFEQNNPNSKPFPSTQKIINSIRI